MAAVELRDIVTEDDVEAVMGLRRGPGQDRFLGSMLSHFEDAVADAKACPRMWSVHDATSGQLVGFVMISDDVPQAILDADAEVVGPYFLWRLLIDQRFQGRGYGTATIDAVADYVAAKPNGSALLTSAVDGDGGPLPFYVRNGFVEVGEMWGETLLRLDLAGRRARSGLGAAAGAQSSVAERAAIASIGGPA